MPEFALTVPFDLPIELVGIPNDMPQHVTIVYPSAADVEAIAQVLEPFDPFEVTFERLDRFPGVLWLAPEPAEPFVAMTKAMVSRFPDFPPYGGTYSTIIPHLTVAQAALDETAALVEPLLPLRSYVDGVVLHTSVDSRHWREHATFDLG